MNPVSIFLAPCLLCTRFNFCLNLFKHGFTFSHISKHTLLSTYAILCVCAALQLKTSGSYNVLFQMTTCCFCIAARNCSTRTATITSTASAASAVIARWQMSPSPARTRPCSAMTATVTSSPPNASPATRSSCQVNRLTGADLGYSKSLSAVVSDHHQTPVKQNSLDISLQLIS